MEQDLDGRGLVEIAALRPEHEVRDEACAGRHLLAQLAILVAEQQEPAQHEGHDQDEEQRRQDAPDAPAVEIQDAEGAAVEPGEDDRGDQEARDHEEDVDAHEAARQPLREGMENQHRRHRDRPQAVDVGAIVLILLHAWPVLATSRSSESSRPASAKASIYLPLRRAGLPPPPDPVRTPRKTRLCCILPRCTPTLALCAWPGSSSSLASRRRISSRRRPASSNSRLAAASRMRFSSSTMCVRRLWPTRCTSPDTPVSTV